MLETTYSPKWLIQADSNIIETRGPLDELSFFSRLVLAYSLSGLNSSSESQPPNVERATPYLIETDLKLFVLHSILLLP